MMAPLSKTPPCAAYTIGSKSMSLSYLDAVIGQSTCAKTLAGQTNAGIPQTDAANRDCFSLFCPTCPLAHQCDQECGFCRSNMKTLFNNDMQNITGPNLFADTVVQCAYVECMPEAPAWQLIQAIGAEIQLTQGVGVKWSSAQDCTNELRRYQTKLVFKIGHPAVTVSMGPSNCSTLTTRWKPMVYKKPDPVQYNSVAVF